MTSRTLLAILALCLAAGSPCLAAELGPAGSPVRGLAGDFWADVIIGQPDFNEVFPDLPHEWRPARAART